MSDLANEIMLENLFEDVCAELIEKYPYLDAYEVEAMATPICRDRFECWNPWLFQFVKKLTGKRQRFPFLL